MNEASDELAREIQDHLLLPISETDLPFVLLSWSMLGEELGPLFAVRDDTNPFRPAHNLKCRGSVCELVNGTEALRNE